MIVKGDVEIYQTIDHIIDRLDDQSLQQMLSGSQSDVDGMIDIMYDEVRSALAFTPSLISNTKLTNLEALSKDVERTLEMMSFNYFVASVLEDFQMAPHHLEWGNLIQIYKYLTVIAARDHSKSYTFSKAYPLWKMYRYVKMGMNGNPMNKKYAMSKSGLLITNEISLARDLLKKVSDAIQETPKLNEALMPSSKVDLGKDKLLLKNGSELSVRSVGSSMRGLHPHYIIGDDLLNESALYSAEQRDKTWNIFSAVIMNMILPGGEVKVVGTPFHEDDLYTRLKKKGKFKVFYYPAIRPDGTLLWPGRNGLDVLLEKLQLQGSTIFSREIMVQPVTDNSSIFPYKYLNNAISGAMQKIGLASNYRSTFKRFESLHIGCDFAISHETGADYSVFTVLGKDENGILYFLNSWREKGAPYSRQVAVIKKMWRDFQPASIFVESNQMQAIFGQMLRDAGVPVTDAHTGVNKLSLYKGLPALAALFEIGKIKFPYGTDKAKAITDHYFIELNSMSFNDNSGKIEGVGSHDDCAMSLWLAVRAAVYDGDILKML